jgi:outer membrane immunogenic protein
LHSRDHFARATGYNISHQLKTKCRERGAYWRSLMKRLLLAGVGLTTLCLASALAADLPPRMPTKAPAYAPVYNWSGWYLGINGGYGFGRSNWSDTATGATTGGFDIDGGLIGGTLGVNWQSGPWVYGLEADGAWSDMRGSTAVTCAVANCETRNNWLATFRGRVGHAFDRVLPYVTGGLALGDVEAGVAGFGHDGSTQAGWTVGAGVEWAIAGPWTAKVEYLYTDLGTMSCSVASCGGVGPVDVDFTANIIRGGINYRFGPTM